ncbi:MAG TPA: hypothetical protein PKE62_15580 [Anaerolineales bacterium]|nr:hypothetical protein [Anaerolineales bacterium]
MNFRLVPLLLAVSLLSACQPANRAELNEQGFYPLATRTGVNDVDAVLSAVETGVASNVAALFKYSTIPCAKVQALGGPPQCRAGEAENTPMEVLPALFSEGSYFRKDEISTWQGLDARSLYAVFEISESAYTDAYYPAGEYGIVLIRADGSSVILRVVGGGIVRVDYPAGPSFEMLDAIIARDASEMILPPPSR